ncbi:MAG: hypothetical protein ACLFOY_04915 [Desulfatibacillaceae bacterium]
MDGNETNGGRLPKAFLTGLRLLAVLAATLLLLEIGARLLLPQYASFMGLFTPVDDPRGYVLTPETRLEFSGLKEPLPEPVTWRINSQGFREPGVVSRSPTPGTRRVGTFGDSEVFGWAVAGPRAFQSVWEDATPDIEVLNFGVPGYNAVNTAEHLTRMHGRFRFHSAVYVFNTNDLEPDLPGIAFSWPARSPSCLARQVVAMLIVQKQKQQARDRWSEANRNRAARAMRRMAGFCRQQGIELAVVVLDDKAREYVEGVYGDGDVTVLDASEVIAGHRRLDGHLPPEAHAALAGFLAERLDGLSGG